MPITPEQLAIDGNLVDGNYEVTVDPSEAVFITRAGMLAGFQSARGEVTSFDTVGAPPGSFGNEGDQLIVPGHQTLGGVVFHKTQGNWVYVTQAFKPLRTTPPDKSVIAAVLPNSQRYWYYLYAQPAARDNGYYFITSSGVLAGPYTDGASAAAVPTALGDLSDVDAANYSPGHVLTRQIDGSFAFQAGGGGGVLPQAGWGAPAPQVVDREMLANATTVQEITDYVLTVVSDLIAAGVFEA